MEVTVSKAPTLRQLAKLAAEYFYRPVKLDPPFVCNGTGTGVIPYYTVEKKRKLYHLIKL